MAATIEVTELTEYVKGSRLRKATLKCTCHTDGTLGVELPSSVFEWLQGWGIRALLVVNLTADQDPAADSDITFETKEVVGTVADLLSNQGADMLDADTTNFVLFDTLIPIFDTFDIVTANVGANEAIFYLTLICVPTV